MGKKRAYCRTGLNSENKKEKWMSVDRKLLEEKLRVCGEFWINQFDKILAEVRPG